MIVEAEWRLGPMQQLPAIIILPGEKGEQATTFPSRCLALAHLVRDAAMVFAGTIARQPHLVEAVLPLRGARFYERVALVARVDLSGFEE